MTFLEFHAPGSFIISVTVPINCVLDALATITPEPAEVRSMAGKFLPDERYIDGFYLVGSDEMYFTSQILTLWSESLAGFFSLFCPGSRFPAPVNRFFFSSPDPARHWQN
jgi:hypothetical protein